MAEQSKADEKVRQLARKISVAWVNFLSHQLMRKGDGEGRVRRNGNRSTEYNRRKLVFCTLAYNLVAEVLAS